MREAASAVPSVMARFRVLAWQASALAASLTPTLSRREREQEMRLWGNWAG